MQAKPTKFVQNLAAGRLTMYEHNKRPMMMPDEFSLSFGGRLNPNNRWAVMATLIPFSIP